MPDSLGGEVSRQAQPWRTSCSVRERGHVHLQHRDQVGSTRLSGRFWADVVLEGTLGEGLHLEVGENEGWVLQGTCQGESLPGRSCGVEINTAGPQRRPPEGGLACEMTFLHPEGRKPTEPD